MKTREYIDKFISPIIRDDGQYIYILGDKLQTISIHISFYLDEPEQDILEKRLIAKAIVKQ